MNLEIHSPELVQRVNAHIQTGYFNNAEEVLEKALNALDERVLATEPLATATGSVILAALQASPYREIELTQPRVLLGDVRELPDTRASYTFRPVSCDPFSALD